ncbi:uncharacterized protein GIQ15_02115 [Arthroderma uncinatum]|uniref:uncharacterized protein n=1 Tax=Arthroderma uncinatum TaxID=74035 RepID=UPI00144AA26F|nr:uncharacterized protein GIQ15_02115 [Arthroderma uncinatum]KAF3482791.1 hypothetical protein GIQ15_02115 [Arthroderma uncinatum]
MSAVLPYLRALKKSDLVDLAEEADLNDFADLKKNELAVALDTHLTENRSSLSHQPKLSEYYRRLAQPPRGSPIKREPKAEVSSLDGSVKRSTRTRRSIKPKEEVEATDYSDEASDKSSPPPDAAPAVIQTPARPALKFPSLPPSPAVVTDAIDRQTTRVRKSVSEAWDQSGMTERTYTLRSWLSSVNAIQTLITAFELFGVLNEVMPWKYLTTIPATESLNLPEIAIKIPDLFVLLTASFWSPFLLWVTTSIALPSIVAYFVNINLKMSQSAGHSASARRTAASSAQDKCKACGDPLVFNVSKALVAALVYGQGFNFWDLFSAMSLQRVSGAVPGGVTGLLTGSALCTLGSLYEAILRK